MHHPYIKAQGLLRSKWREGFGLRRLSQEDLSASCLLHAWLRGSVG